MKHYAIIAQMRVGYQLLTNLLGSHPDVLALGEIFVDSKDVRTDSMFGTNIPIYTINENPVLYIKNNIDKYAESHGYKITGFKLNYRQQDLWSVVKDWKVIHLTRKNLLDRIISEKLAMQEQNWNFHEYSGRFNLSAHELNLYCEDSIFTGNTVDQFFNPFKLYYEDLAYNTEETIAKVLEYLELEPKPLNTIMKKQRTKSQSAYIANYKELYSELMSSKSEHRRYLTDIPII